MAIELKTELTVWVFLPSEYEQREDLDFIIDALHAVGATETSTIGPCAAFHRLSEDEAKARVMKVLNAWPP